MPLRLLEATVPSEALDQVEGVLGDVPVVDVWTSGPDKPSALVRILLEAEHAEALSDRLVERFGSREGFRLVLLSVEATLPPVEQRDEAAPEGDESPATQGAPERISREELYEDLAQASRVTRVYVVMVALSTIVAAVGLIRGDVAIIIGAMVIAPLLGPNVALALAATLGDLELAKRSLKAIAAGVVTAATASLALGLLLDVDPAIPEVAARTRVGLADIVLALAAGSAGSLAFTSGVPGVVVGVMVAVALLPPLVVAGLLAGAGEGAGALGAGLLTVTNVTCINLAAVATFLAQKVGPRTWWEADRAKKASRVAVATWIVLLLVLITVILLGRVADV